MIVNPIYLGIGQMLCQLLVRQVTSYYTFITSRSTECNETMFMEDPSFQDYSMDLFSLGILIFLKNCIIKNTNVLNFLYL